MAQGSPGRARSQTAPALQLTTSSPSLPGSSSVFTTSESRFIHLQSPSSLYLSPLSSPSWSTTSSSSSPRHRERLLSSRGALSPDRFIPSSSAFPLYHFETPLHDTTYDATGGRRMRRHTGDFPIRPGGVSNSNDDDDDDDDNEGGVSIASALEIAPLLSRHVNSGRVLSFQQPRGGRSGRDSGDRDIIELEALRLSAAALVHGRGRGGSPDSKADKPRRNHRIGNRLISYAPFRVLDAPGLRDDFYTNLLSWSCTTNDLTVGLGSEVYVWQESTGALLVPEWNTSPVACVSFAPDGHTLVIGRMDGTISCWHVPTNKSVADYYHTAGLCCITWRPQPDAMLIPDNYEFYVGDESGEILRFRLACSISIATGGEANRLQLLQKVRGHSQQICGIAFNPSGTQMAVGANDNTCTVWNMAAASGPENAPKYRWDHRAAVKAIAYCPWFKLNLIHIAAVEYFLLLIKKKKLGGGSNDRTVRFWHTNSGSLVHSFNTNAQVTSIIWARSRKEIAITFGYANPDHPIRIALYSYPACKPLIQIPWQEETRCLYAVSSPAGGKICAAASDETVRFYDFWQDKPGTRVSHWDSGIFGSGILELCEGIDETFDGEVR
ncbi:WD40-repeat-containing domain protein [Lipomyces japonicus]|uniref:WD40-repeat-containing domain protein n=1 Tax=Lipomyces japonicus TaxID=56871 RepID=UPI0034CDBC5E